MTYGYSIKRSGPDPLVDLIGKMVANLSLAAVPLTWLVDAIPALKYLPSWFPGMAFKETARQWNKINNVVVDLPYSFVRRQMATGTYQSSYVSKLVQQASNGDALGYESKMDRDEENAIKWTAAVMFAGGADTMTLSLTSFILAMVMFPDVQKKAQEEIDRVIGTHRLPQFEDRANLPYIEGVVKEAFRWSPAAPMGVPHVASEDIIYNGYLIPKGAYLIPAAWWFLHDPQQYIDPTSFNPERYFEPQNEQDPKAVLFGFGRRICPGRHFADQGIFLTIACMLATFNISKAVDKQGLEIEAKLDVKPGLVGFLADFPYEIRPRSANHGELVRRIEAEQSVEANEPEFFDTATMNKWLG